MVSVGTVYNWLHHHPQFARDYGRARQMQAFVMQDRSVDLVLSTGPGGHRQADKVLARMRQRMAVLSAKAWDLDARPGRRLLLSPLGRGRVRGFEAYRFCGGWAVERFAPHLFRGRGIFGARP